MSNEEPTPPPFPYENPSPPAQSQSGQANETYQVIADKVGFVPNLRKSDNLFQLRFLGITLFICISVCMIIPIDVPVIFRAVIGLFIGLFLGLILSGTVLAIKNLKR